QVRFGGEARSPRFGQTTSDGHNSVGVGSPQHQHRRTTETTNAPFSLTARRALIALSLAVVVPASLLLRAQTSQTQSAARWDCCRRPASAMLKTSARTADLASAGQPITGTREFGRLVIDRL
ncbi:MAG: hypothetical protein HQ485_05610, partial [Acidobacteria bacterium]|nr:hypothetical protein [Acidobacteriota bacterium]